MTTIQNSKKAKHGQHYHWEKLFRVQQMESRTFPKKHKKIKSETLSDKKSLRKISTHAKYITKIDTIEKYEKLPPSLIA